MRTPKEGALKRKRVDEKRTKLNVTEKQSAESFDEKVGEISKVMMASIFKTEMVEIVENYKDEVYYPLLGHINLDSTSYVEDMQSKIMHSGKRPYLNDEVKSMEEHV